jgi:hypothetical protein
VGTSTLRNETSADCGARGSIKIRNIAASTFVRQMEAFQASVVVQLRHSLFWDVTQRKYLEDRRPQTETTEILRLSTNSYLIFVHVGE